MRFVDVELAAAHLTPGLAREAVMSGLREQLAGTVRLSEPRVQFLPIDERTRFQSKGASLGGRQIAGFRLAGERDHRYEDRGRLLLLYDTRCLQPIAAVAEAGVYRARVGAQVALAVSALRARSATRLVMVGSGRLSASALRAVQTSDPAEAITIVSRRRENAVKLADTMAEEFPLTRWEVADTVEEAASTAQVLITLTNATQPLVQAGMFAPGMLIVSAGGGVECGEDVYACADRIVVDDLPQCRHFGDLAPLINDGRLDETAVSASLAEVVVGRSSVRASPADRIVAVTQGMAILDVAVALAVVEAMT